MPLLAICSWWLASFSRHPDEETGAQRIGGERTWWGEASQPGLESRGVLGGADGDLAMLVRAQVQQPRPAGLALWAGRVRHSKVKLLSGPACACHVPLHWRLQWLLGQQGQSCRALPLARLTPVPTLMWDSGFSRSLALYCLGSISLSSRDLSKVSGLGEAWALQGLEPLTLCHQVLP